ncbi:hypothetical protein Cgig2_007249 [Carnegiea gigantea]|uniref:Uncharacterized protein n=1 Tax=Carnegiea gigantea TaxID=171969 RepID=A0A9Q1KVP7_9CARY|nr:hypothetical protein Cgig2_007249 [Carnegiea gigantea]
MATNRGPKACFSFAAYAKGVIAALKSAGVHVSAGLSDAEISEVESAADFTFPPDLRAILAEGLPVGPGFPNWRSSSRHQLRLLTSLPALSLAKEVSRNNFWAHSCWGPRPDNKDDAIAVARSFLGRAPPLVPVFRHCYIPSQPDLAGNPVFYVRRNEVRLLSVDVGGFFKDTQFWRKDYLVLRGENQNGLSSEADSPAWATAARRVEFWTEVAEIGPSFRRWWSFGAGELGGCLEDVMWRLRDAGWGEDDVREMMMIDGDDAAAEERLRTAEEVRDREGVARHVRSLSRELLKGGWSIDDVVYSLSDEGKIESEILEGESWVDFQCGEKQYEEVDLERSLIERLQGGPLKAPPQLHELIVEIGSLMSRNWAINFYCAKRLANLVAAVLAELNKEQQLVTMTHLRSPLEGLQAALELDEEA